MMNDIADLALLNIKLLIALFDTFCYNANRQS